MEAHSKISHFISEIDLLQSNVLNAVENGYTRPRICIDDAIENSFIKANAIRHPIIEYISKNTQYVPNDIILGYPNVTDINSKQDGILLFGVNAVGKSSLMKSVGVNIIMAQSGMFVACSIMEYKPFKYLFTRILGNDNLYAGLSSFEVEMKEFKTILKYANSDSILLCDELFRGTQVNDAEALVASGLEILSKRKVKFVSATHLHSLTKMTCIQNLDNVKSYHLLVENDPDNPRKLIYNRKLKSGSGPSSYGILVADTMNIDSEFITRAKEIRMQTDNYNVKMGSKYNKEKIISKCEVCNINNAIDVHHINQQCTANNADLIENNISGIFNKNKLWNLVGLCKSCHISVHNSPPQLNIIGYQKTSSGIELQYKWINTNNLQINNLTNQNIINECIKKDIMPDTLNTPYTTENISENNSQIQIDTIIRDMKFKNATPKKIQSDIKRIYNVNITQQYIRNLI